MKLLGLLSLVWLNLALAAPADYLYRDDPEAKAVIEHSTKTPETDFEASTKPRLVEFYSPFCGGCRNFKPKYISLAEQIHKKYEDVEVYAVSCSPYKELCNKHKIQGYPSLFAFPAGSTEGAYLQKTDMGGTYTVEAIATALKVDSKSSKTTSKTKQVLEKSDDEKKTKKTSKKEDSDDEDEKKKTKKTSKKEDSDDDEKKTSKKDDSDDTEKKDDSEEEDKKTSKMKNSDDDKKDDSEEEVKKISKKDDDSDDKPVKSASTKKVTSKKEKKASKEQSKEDSATATERKLNDEKDSEGDKDEKEDDKDDEKSEDEKSDDKEDDKEDDKSDDKDDEKSDDKEDDKDDEKSDDKEDDKDEEKSDDKDDEDDKDLKEIKEEDDEKDSDEEKSDDKDDVKSDDKDDEKSDDKDDEKSDDKDDEKSDDENEDKDDEDDKDDEESKEDDEEKDDKDSKDSKDDDTVSGGGDASGGSAIGSRTSAGRQAISSVGGIRPSLPGKIGKYPGAGAHKAQLKERDMDRWKKIMEQRKKLIEQKKGKGFLRPSSASTRFKEAGPGGLVKLNAPGRAGSTKVMRANTPGTDEFAARKKEILDKITRAKKAKGGALGGILAKKQAAETTWKKSKLPFKKDIKKPGIVRKTVEKLPGIKRLVRMTPEEELILDASRSFVTGLKHGVFMNNEELPEKKKAALQSWLELVSVSLPPEWGLHALIDDLLENINTVSKSNVNLQKALYKHPLNRQRWSKSCDKMGGGGFSCGMWKLFHIVTIGVAEHHGGQNMVDSQMVESDTRTFSPADAAETIRDYMTHFFGCDDCRQHFIERYDSCAFRRCDRLTEDIDGATPDDWKQLSLWMWEVHNDVNIRVSNKKVNNLKKHLASKHLQGAQTLKLTQTEESEIQVLWPSLESCLVCFDDSGSWNEDSVFEFLERTYWDAPDAKFDRLLTARKLEGEDPSGGGLVWIMILIAICIVWNLRRHVQNSSFHKHIQMPTSVMGVGNKLGDAMAGKKRTA